MGRLSSIQCLRGAAALAVVVYHALMGVGVQEPGFASGVDLFFVISGFVMQSAIDERPQTPLGFLRRRLIRVGPPYWIATLLAFFLARAAPDWVAADPSLDHLLRSLAFIPHYDGQGGPFPTLKVGWTLNYEMLFYGLVALGLFAPRDLRPWLVGAALLALGQFGRLDARISQALLNRTLWEFVFGLVLARLFAAGGLRSPAVGAALLAWGLVLIAAPAAMGLDGYVMRWLIWGVPAALVVAGALSLEKVFRHPKLAPARALGDMSYALYLAHYPVCGAVAVLAARLGGLPAPVSLGLQITASVVAGLLFHRLVERPTLRLLARPAQASEGK